jgi:hypothetical protein
MIEEWRCLVNSRWAVEFSANRRLESVRSGAMSEWNARVSKIRKHDAIWSRRRDTTQDVLGLDVPVRDALLVYVGNST